MSDFTDEDVQRGAEAAFFSDMIGGHHNGLFTWDSIPEEGRENYRTMMRHVLAAVLPEYRKRVRAEALREAADALPMDGPLHIMDRQVHQDFLRARADAEEGK
jgi:hypothetical protein